MNLVICSVQKAFISFLALGNEISRLISSFTSDLFAMLTPPSIPNSNLGSSPTTSPGRATPTTERPKPPSTRCSKTSKRFSPNTETPTASGRRRLRSWPPSTLCRNKPCFTTFFNRLNKASISTSSCWSWHILCLGKEWSFLGVTNCPRLKLFDLFYFFLEVQASDPGLDFAKV